MLTEKHLNICFTYKTSFVNLCKLFNCTRSQFFICKLVLHCSYFSFFFISFYGVSEIWNSALLYAQRMIYTVIHYLVVCVTSVLEKMMLQSFLREILNRVPLWEEQGRLSSSFSYSPDTCQFQTLSNNWTGILGRPVEPNSTPCSSWFRV